MHKHQFQFSSNWPNDLVCKHTCRTTQNSCSGLASDDVHAVRGTRYVPAGFFTSAQLARIPELLVRNPAKIDVLGFEREVSARDDGPLHPGDDVALTPGQLNDFELCIVDALDDEHGELEMRCWGGDQVLTVANFDTTRPRLSTVLEKAREHWLRYHSSLRH